MSVFLSPITKALQRVVVCLMFITSFALPLITMGGVNKELEDEAKKLKEKFLQINDDRLQTFLNWIAPLEPPHKMWEKRERFNQEAKDFMRFFVSLHRYEQLIYLRLIEAYAYYQKKFKSFDVWFYEIKTYHKLFTSSQLEKLPGYFREIPEVLWKKGLSDPFLMGKILTYYPINPCLKVYHDYWTTLLAWKNKIDFPSWELFQEEMDDIGYTCRQDRDKGEPIFLWQGRFDEGSKLKLEELKRQLLLDSVRWSVEEQGLDLNVSGDIVTSLSLNQLKTKILQDKEDIFKRIFTWKVDFSKYDDEEKSLLVKILLPTGNGFELKFFINEEIKANITKLYFTLEIPTISETNIFMKNWEVVVEIRPHQKFKDLSHVFIRSNTAIRSEWAKKQIRLEETRRRIQTELPQKLKDFKNFLEVTEPSTRR